MYGATLLKTTAKLGVAGSAIYVTSREGVWSTSSQGSLALDKVQTSVLPTTTAYLQKVPSTDYMSNRVVNTWNSGVKTVFQGLNHAPENISFYSKKAMEYMDKRN